SPVKPLYLSTAWYLALTAGQPTSITSVVFQAEDGIRDKLVTGVQTCSLPISDGTTDADGRLRPLTDAAEPLESRSEERRVGKECRSRGSPSHYKKHNTTL